MLRQNRVVRALLGIPIVCCGLLLVLAGCGTVPPAATLPSMLPAVAEGSPPIPPTPEAYIPPSPETWPTALPEPTANPRPTLEMGRVVRGQGNFPRLPVAAMAGEDGTLALYMVQGDAATLLVGLENDPNYSFDVNVQLSPSGRYVACQTLAWSDGASALELVDTLAPQRLSLYQSQWNAALPGEKRQGTWADWLTSFVWLDDTHLLYTVRLWHDNPDPAACAKRPCPMPGELWMTDLDGAQQRLLTLDRLDQVLGVSPDGQRAYFLRLGAEWVSGGPGEWYELYSLDLTSGVTATLWPQANDPNHYTGYTLLPSPDGAQRLLFHNLNPGNTVSFAPPVIWMLDPDSGAAAAIWTNTQGEMGSKGEGMMYDIPVAYLWSPLSEQDFVYQADGSVLGGIWWVDLEAQQSHLLSQEWGQLLTWTAEGLVVHKRGYQLDVLLLVGADGQLQGEIDFFP